VATIDMLQWEPTAVESLNFLTLWSGGTQNWERLLSSRVRETPTETPHSNRPDSRNVRSQKRAH